MPNDNPQTANDIEGMVRVLRLLIGSLRNSIGEVPFKMMMDALDQIRKEP